MKQLTGALTRIGLLGLGLLGLAAVAIWTVAQDAIRQAAPVVVWSMAAVTTLAAIAWLVSFAIRLWSESQAHRAESHRRRIEAASAAALVETKARAEARIAAAEARKAEREADLFVITAADGEQVFVSDSNPGGRFVAAHLALSGQINGREIQPTPLQAAAWDRWQTARTSHPAPAIGAGPDTTGAALPDKINLLDLLPTDGPTLNRIALGVALGDGGTVKPLSAPLAKMVHVGIGGSSGWGKSVFLQGLAFQIATAPEAAQLALIDIEAQTFSPFAGLGGDRLRYPLVDNEADILAILDDLRGEWHRRRELFRDHPQAADLADYNRLTADPLPYIVLMVDEVNAIVDDPDILSRLTSLGQGTRKYGLYLALGGQDWNAASIPTKLRNNFSTRIQLRAMSKSQSRVMLEDSAAAEIDRPGRAYAVLPGREMTEIQTPFVDKQTLAAALLALAAGGPPPVMPDPATVTPQGEPMADQDQTGRAEEIRRLHADGMSKTAIARHFGYKTYAGTIFYQIRDALGEE